MVKVRLRPADEAKRATKVVYEGPKARRRGLEVVLSGLTESSFRARLAPKHTGSHFDAYLQNVG